jgi:AcrR family transcriptional regulator
MTSRAAATARTRERIVRAACTVYARVGFRAATFQAIGREARVSPATVLNHFAEPDELLAAALAYLTSELGLPDPATVQARPALADRVTVVCRAFAECFERGARWYALYARDRDHPVAKAANDAFFLSVDALIRAALGPKLRDKQTLGMVSTLVGWQNFQSLRATGMSVEAAGDAIAEVVLGWLQHRRKR